MLYGGLGEIRRRFSGHAVLVRTTGELPTVPGVEQISSHNSATKLTLAEHVTPQDMLQTLVAQGVVLESFEIAIPTLEEIFIRVVEGDA